VKMATVEVRQRKRLIKSRPVTSRCWPGGMKVAEECWLRKWTPGQYPKDSIGAIKGLWFHRNDDLAAIRDSKSEEDESLS
jgi:hypothetical protein